jgi:hypothetical protein
MKKTMSESTFDNKLRPNYYENNYANMAAAFVVETERWQLTPTLFPSASSSSQASLPQLGSSIPAGSHAGHGASAPVTNDGPAIVRTSNTGKTLPLFVRGLSSAAGGTAEVEQFIAGLKNSGSGPMMEIRELEVAALAASMKKDHATAIDLMRKAVGLEEQLGPPAGPPQLVKPSHELFGEILLRSGKPDQALAQFRNSLLRQPNRARSLIGAARAASQSGDQKGAANYYSSLLAQWKQADEDLPELREAQEFVKKVGTLP